MGETAGADNNRTVFKNPKIASKKADGPDQASRRESQSAAREISMPWRRLSLRSRPTIWTARASGTSSLKYVR